MDGSESNLGWPFSNLVVSRGKVNDKEVYYLCCHFQLLPHAQGEQSFSWGFMSYEDKAFREMLQVLDVDLYLEKCFQEQGVAGALVVN